MERVHTASARWLGLFPHRELEETIADFKHADAAITYSSGYATNLTAVSTLVGREDYVISDKQPCQYCRCCLIGCKIPALSA
jgi:7-keto-8-aminopelargonate synthetase-like enzyme